MNRHTEFTPHENQYLLWLIFFVLAGLMMFVSGQTSSAQIIRTKPTPTPQVRRTPPPVQKIIVFKGTGTQRQQPKLERFEQFRQPARLTLAEKQNLFNEALPANGVPAGAIDPLPFAELSVRTPYFDNKAYIDFGSLLRTSSYANVAVFLSPKPEILWLVFIKPTRAGQWFLIDCSLNVYGQPGTFQVRSPDSGIVAEKTIMGDGHIQAFLVAQNTDWQILSFSTTGMNYESKLFSCEITKKD